MTGVNTRLLRNVQLLIDHWRLLPLGVTGLQHVYVTCVNIVHILAVLHAGVEAELFAFNHYLLCIFFI